MAVRVFGRTYSSNTGWSRLVLPMSAPVYRVEKRRVSSDTKRGAGGRSSFSGVIATVFGSTGFYGRYVVNRLGQTGSQLVIPYRGDEHDYRHLRLMGDLGQIVFLPYSIRDKPSIARCIKHSNVVINLVGRDYETYRYKFPDVHVEGARAIAEACQSARMKRLIHVSALGASTDSPSRFLQSKAEGELAVKDAFPEATIIRPAETFGHEDRYFNYYAKYRMVTKGTIPLPNYGLNIYKYPVYVGDIAQAIVNIILDPTTRGKTFEFLGPKQYELLDLVDYLYRVMHRRFRPLSPPDFWYRFGAWVMEQTPFVPVLTRDLLIRRHLTEKMSGDLPGLEDVGVSPANVEDHVLAIVRRFRALGSYNTPIDESGAVDSS